MLQVGDKVRYVRSDMPLDLYYEVLETGLPEGHVGGPRVLLRTPVGTEVSAPEGLLTTDGPLEELPHLRVAWAGARLQREGKLDRSKLGAGKAVRRTAKMKEVMDQAEADAAWAWGVKARYR